MIDQPSTGRSWTTFSPVSVGLLITLTLPPAIFVLVTASSMSVGVTASSIIWYALALGCLRGLRRSDSSWFIAAFAAVLFFIAHAGLSDQFTRMVDYQRLAMSLLLFVINVCAAGLAARCLAMVKPAKLIAAANMGLGFLGLLGVASLLGAPPIGPQASVKAVVIFSEPSHFGLAYLPLLLFRVSTCSRRQQVALLGCSLALGAALQSLVLIAGVFLVACVLLRSVPIIILVLCAGAGALALDLTYYISRLTLTSDSENLSALVFLQGWDNAVINFKETRGFGVGFQQFGIAGSTGEVADRISELFNDSISLLDGGSTASKLVGEFGIIGLLIIGYLIKRIAAAAIYIRRAQRSLQRARDVTTLLFSSLVMSYVVELFIRGTGYFSAGGFLLVAGLIGLKSRPVAPTPQSPDTSQVGN